MVFDLPIQLPKRIEPGRAFGMSLRLGLHKEKFNVTIADYWH